MVKVKSKLTGEWINYPDKNYSIVEDEAIENVGEDIVSPSPIGNSAISIQFITELLYIKGILTSEECEEILSLSNLYELDKYLIANCMAKNKSNGDVYE